MRGTEFPVVHGRKMGLQALEFTDCLTDSPLFRDNLHAHEKELERTSSQIKGLVKDVKDILSAARGELFFLIILITAYVNILHPIFSYRAKYMCCYYLTYYAHANIFVVVAHTVTHAFRF